MRITSVIIIIVTLVSCGRTPSKERFEENTGISLPKDIQVTRDDYFNLIQDYEILFTADLTKNQVEYIVEQIIGSDSNWSAINIGYEYQSDYGRLQFSAIIDTVGNNMEYREGYD